MNPLRIGVRYFPNHKGLVSGLIVGCYGSATLIVSFMVVAIINPDNCSPIYHKSQDYYEYPVNVINRVPLALKVVSAYFLFLALLGSLLLKNKKDHQIVMVRTNSLRFLDSLAISKNYYKSNPDLK